MAEFNGKTRGATGEVDDSEESSQKPSYKSIKIIGNFRKLFLFSATLVQMGSKNMY